MLFIVDVPAFGLLQTIGYFADLAFKVEEVFLADEVERRKSLADRFCFQVHFVEVVHQSFLVLLNRSHLYFEYLEAFL